MTYKYHLFQCQTKINTYESSNSTSATTAKMIAENTNRHCILLNKFKRKYLKNKNNNHFFKK